MDFYLVSDAAVADISDEEVENLLKTVPNQCIIFRVPSTGHGPRKWHGRCQASVTISDMMEKVLIGLSLGKASPSSKGLCYFTDSEFRLLPFRLRRKYVHITTEVDGLAYWRYGRTYAQRYDTLEEALSRKRKIVPDIDLNDDGPGERLLALLRSQMSRKTCKALKEECIRLLAGMH